MQVSDFPKDVYDVNLWNARTRDIKSRVDQMNRDYLLSNEQFEQTTPIIGYHEGNLISRPTEITFSDRPTENKLRRNNILDGMQKFTIEKMLQKSLYAPLNYSNRIENIKQTAQEMGNLTEWRARKQVADLVKKERDRKVLQKMRKTRSKPAAHPKLPDRIAENQAYKAEFDLNKSLSTERKMFWKSLSSIESRNSAMAEKSAAARYSNRFHEWQEKFTVLTKEKEKLQKQLLDKSSTENLNKRKSNPDILHGKRNNDYSNTRPSSFKNSFEHLNRASSMSDVESTRRNLKEKLEQSEKLKSQSLSNLVEKVKSLDNSDRVKHNLERKRNENAILRENLIDKIETRQTYKPTKSSTRTLGSQKSLMNIETMESKENERKTKIIEQLKSKFANSERLRQEQIMKSKETAQVLDRSYIVLRRYNKLESERQKSKQDLLDYLNR